MLILDRDRLISLYREKIGELSKPLKIGIAILFDSYAFERYTPASDVDLFIVVEEECRDEAYRIVLECLNLSNLQLHLYYL